MSAVTESKIEQPVNRPAEQQLAAFHAKNAELLAQLDEYHAQQNVAKYRAANDDVIIADEVAPHIINAQVDYYKGHPMIEQRLVPCGKKDDYGRKSQRYGTYEITDFADLLGFIGQEYDGITVKNLEKLVGELNPSLSNPDGKLLRIRITVNWGYDSSLDMAGHKTTLAGISFPNLNSYPDNHVARKCARFILAL